MVRPLSTQSRSKNEETNQAAWMMDMESDMSPAGNRPPRQLSINRLDLESAFEGFPSDAEYYLDTETGSVVFVTEDVRSELDSILSDVPETADGEIDLGAVEAALEKSHTAEWLAEMVLEAARVEADTKGRFIDIPQADSREKFMLMESFIETVSDPRAQNRLWKAIRERQSFRRFKDVLIDSPSEEERWYAYEQTDVHRRMQEWLEEQGILATLVDGV